MSERIVLAEFDAVTSYFDRKLEASERKVLDSQKRIEQSQQRLSKGTNMLAGSFASLAGAAGLMIGGAEVIQFFKDSVEYVEREQRALKELDTVLKSTGSAAGLTTTELYNMAQSLESLNRYKFDDKEIMEVQSVLLTFKAVNRTIFQEAMQLAMDLSVRFDQDLKGSIVQVGKALQDPISGVTALRRVGVQLSDQQEKQIKVFMKSGQILKAQRIILDELSSQVSGAAANSVTDYEFKVNQMNETLESTKKILGEMIIPAMSKFTEGVGTAANNVNTLVTGLQKMGNDPVIGKVFEWFTKFGNVFGQIGQSSAMTNEDFIKRWNNTPGVDRKIVTDTKQQNNTNEIKKNSTQILKNNTQNYDIDKKTTKEKEKQAKLSKEIADETSKYAKYMNSLMEMQKLGASKNMRDEYSGPSKAPFGSANDTEDVQENARASAQGMKYLEEATKRTEMAGRMVEGTFTGFFEAMRIEASENASFVEKAFVGLANSFIEQIGRMISEWLMFKFITGALSFGMGGAASAMPEGPAGWFNSYAHSGGVFGAGSNGIRKFGRGVDSFMVPYGFPNDSFPVMVQTGEELSVTPRGGQKSDIGVVNAIKAMNMTISSLLMNRRASDKGPININIDGKTLAKITFKNSAKVQKTGYNTREYQE